MIQSLYPFEKLWAITQFKYEDKEMKRVAGVDVSYRDNRYASALVILEEQKVVDVRVKSGTSPDPYRPSLFFLKEAPIISDLIYKEPLDLLFVNGHGICHPNLYGLATVVGLTHGIPTVGIARKLLKGQYEETGSADPSIRFVVQNKTITGMMISLKKRHRPLIVSQGFGISLKRTLNEYTRWTKNGKTPEPLRLAHLHSKRLFREQ
jgi:deoxyribonuclease V